MSASSEQSASQHVSDAGSSNFTRDLNLWFNDGSIIIVCASSSFRVSESVLSINSLVFKDMFSSSSASSNETVEGCPVVRLTDDPVDMQNFLMMVHYRSFWQDKRSVTLVQLRSALRIASKYQAFSLRKELVDHLKLLFPSTLKGYCSDKRNEILPAHRTSENNPMIGVEIALQFELPIILPCALYLSSQLPILEIMCGHGPNEDLLIQDLLPVCGSILIFRDTFAARVTKFTLHGGRFYCPIDAICADGEEGGSICAGITREALALFAETYHGAIEIFGERRFKLSPEDFNNISPLCHHCIKARYAFERKNYQPLLWVYLASCCPDSLCWDDRRIAQNTSDEKWSI